MENNRFYTKYQSKTDAELKSILLNSKKYTENAVQAAKQLLEERNVELTSEIKNNYESTIAYQEKRKKLRKKNNETAEWSLTTKRFFALIGDFIAVILIHFLINYFIELVGLNPFFESEVIGACILLLYFSILNSSLTQFSTIGNEAFQLKVIDINGQELPFVQSFTRTIVFAFPLLLGNLINDALASISIVGFLLTSVLIFSRDEKYRRSLHDLLFNTIVTDDANQTIEGIEPKKSTSYYKIASLSSLVLLFAYHYSFNKTQPLHIPQNHEEVELAQEQRQLFEILSSITELEEVEYCAEANLTSSYSSSTALELTVVPKVDLESSLAEAIFNHIKGQARRLPNVHEVKIILVRKRKLGFITFTDKFSQSFLL